MILRRRRTGTDDGRTALLAAARSGDGDALAALRADLAPEAVALLAGVLAPTPVEPAAVLRAARSAQGEALSRVVPLLVDDGRRSPALVAELLDLPVADVLAVLAGSRADREPRAGCRGWPLVAAAERLTPAEQEAARAHLEGCRRCSEARAGVPGARQAVPAPRAAG